MYLLILKKKPKKYKPEANEIRHLQQGDGNGCGEMTLLWVYNFLYRFDLWDYVNISWVCCRTNPLSKYMENNGSQEQWAHQSLHSGFQTPLSSKKNRAP